MKKKSSQKAVPVFLIHHQHLVRDVLQGALNRREEVLIVGQSESIESAIEQLSVPALAAKVEVILFDIALDQTPGLRLTKNLRRTLPPARLVVFGLKKDSQALAYISAGVNGFVPPNAALSALIKAVSEPTSVAPEIVDVLVENIPKLETWSHGILTPRQNEVLHWMAQGYGDKRIALEMRISLSTVKSHVQGLLKRLQVDSRYAALNYAVQAGWIPTGQGGDPHAKNGL